MNNVVALTLRTDAIRRSLDGYDEPWNTYFRSVYPVFDRDVAVRMADSHIKHMKRRDDAILAQVAKEMAEPQHA